MHNKVVKSKKNTSGQVLVEYVIALVIVTFIALSCIELFTVFSEYGLNVRKQISVDMP